MCTVSEELQHHQQQIDPVAAALPAVIESILPRSTSDQFARPGRVWRLDVAGRKSIQARLISTDHLIFLLSPGSFSFFFIISYELFKMFSEGYDWNLEFFQDPVRRARACKWQIFACSDMCAWVLIRFYTAVFSQSHLLFLELL